MEQDYTVSYCDNGSILIINALGHIRRLYTPFRVRCKADHMSLKEGMSIYVEEVIATAQDELLYITSTGTFPHSCFTIVASF